MNIKQWITPALIIGSLMLNRAAAAADAPTLDSILAKHVDAMGGKEAIEKIHSRVARFTIESDTLANSQGEVLATVPNHQRTHLELGGLGTIDEGFDGAMAWAKNPWQALRIKAGDELAKVKRDADFHRDLKLKSLYPGLAYKNSEKVGEEETYLLESKPSPSSKERFWLSAKTGLLVRQESEFEGPQGTVNATAIFQDYKAFDGVKYPVAVKMKISASGQNFEFTMKTSEVKNNVEVDAAKFAKPSE